jgi:transcriptional regulator with XRE-family HTH domain
MFSPTLEAAMLAVAQRARIQQMAFFGEWLARRRAELGLTVRDVASAVDVAPAKISSWERGLEEPPNEIRDACWDALKRDGEVPPLDPAPCQDPKDSRPADSSSARQAPVRPGRRSPPQTWLEEFAIGRGTTLDAVLKAFGMSASSKSQWRAGGMPSRTTQWKLVQFLEIPEELARSHGWDPLASEED